MSEIEKRRIGRASTELAFDEIHESIKAICTRHEISLAALIGILEMIKAGLMED